MRRRMLLGAGAIGLAVAGIGALAVWRRRERGRRDLEAALEAQPPASRPEGVPVSRFDFRSTAEDVTAGLDLSGRTMLVTGVTSGIGRELLRVLALRGAHVIGTGRTLERARKACRVAEGGRATPLALELTDPGSVVACADAVSRLAPTLDALICNAGIMAPRELGQVNGIEQQFATNHLGHFLLVRRLLDRVIAAPQGRVVVVSSAVLGWASPAGIEWDNLSGARDYDPQRMYGQSKLANALFSLELARRLQGTRATSNALHPGYVDTDLFRNYPRGLRGYNGLLSAKLTVAQGAATPCYVATSPALAQTGGHFFMECNPVIPDERARDAAAAERLWAVSEQLLRPHLV